MKIAGILANNDDENSSEEDETNRFNAIFEQRGIDCMRSETRNSVMAPYISCISNQAHS
jgi:hypothetical protein